jgi:hypothetical protein
VGVCGCEWVGVGVGECGWVGVGVGVGVSFSPTPFKLFETSFSELESVYDLGMSCGWFESRETRCRNHRNFSTLKTINRVSKLCLLF